MIDEYSSEKTAPVSTPELVDAQEQRLIRFKDAIFSWNAAKDGSQSPSHSLNLPDVTFVKGKINLITGATGSGKSSVLKVSRRAGTDITILYRVMLTMLGPGWRAALCASLPESILPSTSSWRSQLCRARKLVHVRVDQR